MLGAQRTGTTFAASSSRRSPWASSRVVPLAAWAAGGYLLAALPRAAGQVQSAGVSARRSASWLRAAITAAVLAGTVGVLIVGAQYRGWPDSRGLTAALQTFLALSRSIESLSTSLSKEI